MKNLNENYESLNENIFENILTYMREEINSDDLIKVIDNEINKFYEKIF